MSESVIVGLKNLYYALLTSDTASVSAVYQAPVLMAPIINAKITRKSSGVVLYSDNQPSEFTTLFSETDIELDTKNLPLAIQAVLLGHTLAGGVMTKGSGDVAPYVAIGFETSKANGTKRYVWFFKGKFMVPDDDFKTRADKINYNTPKLKGTFIMRDFDGNGEKVADEEDAGYVASVGTNWYTSVQGAADTTAPTVTIVPANAATGIAVGSTVVWTFSEAIQWVSAADAATKFSLINDTTGATIAGVLSINALHTVVTFTPTANLSATTAYRAIANVGVKDLAGNALATNSVTKFTTV